MLRKELEKCSAHGEVCQNIKLKDNVGKGKVMKYSCSKSMILSGNGVELEVVNEFKYLGSNVCANGG